MNGNFLGIMRVFDRKRGWNLHSCQAFCFLWNNQLKEELTAEMRRKKIKLIWPINGYHERKSWQDHTLTFCKFIADVWEYVNGAAEPQQCSSAEESFGQRIRLGWWSWGAAVSSLGLPLPVQLERKRYLTKRLRAMEKELRVHTKQESETRAMAIS